LCESWESDTEIRCRIENVLTNTDFDLGLRIIFAKFYVWTVLLYGMEGGSLVWFYRRVLRIPWTARRTNDEVLRIINKYRELLDTIKRRKTAYLGHVIRNERYQFPQLIIEGKRGIGRKKMSWLRNVRQWTGLRTMRELMHTIRNKEEWTNVIANIH